MALQPEHEAPVGGLETLDEVTGRAARPGVGNEPGCQVRRQHRLVVVGVHAEHAATRVGREEDAREPRAGRHANRVDLGRSPPEGRPEMAIDMLEEAAAGEHVDRLEPATDPEDRQATFLRDGPRVGLERIARRFDGGRPALGRPIARRVEVCATAQQQAIHRRERIGQAFGPGGCVDHDRAGTLAGH